MKKVFPYVLGAVVVVLLGFIIASSSAGPYRRFDERLTLRATDRIPYGTRVAYELLPSLFPLAKTMAEVAAPGNWDSLSSVEDNQAVILVADYFDADIEELERLTEFVERGNHVFVIARTAANDVETYFGFSSTVIGSYNGDDASDSLHVNLVSPAFSKTPNFT
ncbi:MAG TPA: DUF4350 domain-containing protein, partial [Flavisolibacter sp.]|nr:DUF4350 domain-containing protein [Flavisolibacter sp.]